MKKSELENRIKEIPLIVQSRIETKPLSAVGVAFILGMIVVGWPKFIFTLLLLSAAAGVVLWFLGEDDNVAFGDRSKDQRTENSNGETINGQAKDHS